MEFRGKNIKIFPRSVQSIVDSVEDGEVELIVSDWMSTDWPIRNWIYDIVGNKIPVKIIDVDDPWFSRGRGLNISAKEAASDILFFIDADIIMTREVILDAYKKCGNNLTFYPVCRHESRDEWISSGWGLCAVPKSMWSTVGGWKEWSSWGGEDNAFRGDILRAGGETFRDRYEGFLHIDHPRDYSVYKNDLGSDYKLLVKSKQRGKVIEERKKREAGIAKRLSRRRKEISKKRTTPKIRRKITRRRRKK